MITLPLRRFGPRTGKVIGQYRRHRAVEFYAKSEVPAGLDVHLNNYATHKTALMVRQTAPLPYPLHAHQRLLNLVERWFGLLKKRRRGVHQSSGELRLPSTVTWT